MLLYVACINSGLAVELNAENSKQVGLRMHFYNPNVTEVFVRLFKHKNQCFRLVRGIQFVGCLEFGKPLVILDLTRVPNEVYNSICKLLKKSNSLSMKDKVGEKARPTLGCL